jgi:DNA-binding NtrC family response regulator
MLKRAIILQDEQLVVKEIQRHMQRKAEASAVAVAQPIAMAVPAVAAAAVGAGPEGPFTFSEPEMPETESPASDEGSSSLASVAKAAALKAERAAIEQTLRQVHWNRRKAAMNLGVSYKTLLNKIKECGISRV